MANNDDCVFELDDSQIDQLLSLAQLKPSDTFYDLGSGHGRVIIQAVKLTQVKNAIGIEIDRRSHEAAVNSAIDELSKDQLKRTGFWFGSWDADSTEEKCGYQYELDDATVIYYATDETLTTIEDLEDQLGERPVKIITKNLPFVGYKSIATNEKNARCRFFLMQYPFTRVKDVKVWADSVYPGASISMLHSYYIDKIRQQYPGDEKYVRAALMDFKRLVHERFFEWQYKHTVLDALDTD
jgi:hypothetical protein